MLDSDKVKLEAVEWHFFPSVRNNSFSIGMTPQLKEYLIKHNIPYVIHLP